MPATSDTKFPTAAAIKKEKHVNKNKAPIPEKHTTLSPQGDVKFYSI